MTADGTVRRIGAKLLAHLADRGVGGVTLGPGVVRLVTHADIDDDALAVAVAAIGDAP